MEHGLTGELKVLGMVGNKEKNLGVALNMGAALHCQIRAHFGQYGKQWLSRVLMLQVFPAFDTRDTMLGYGLIPIQFHYEC